MKERNLLNRLIELIQPSNSRIDAIKDADDEAKRTIEIVDSENETYDVALKDLNKNIKDLLGFKDALAPIGKNYINVIENNNLPFDMANINQICKSIVDRQEEEIADITKKRDDNNAKKEVAEKVVNETDIKLKEEEQTRQSVNSLIEIALEDGSEITKGRIRDSLKTLNEFTPEEIESMLPAILFPEQGLKAAFHNFNENKGKSTREMLQEAIKNQDVPIVEDEIKEEKKAPAKKTATKAKKVVDLEDVISKKTTTKKVVSAEKIEETKVEDKKESKENKVKEEKKVEVNEEAKKIELLTKVLGVTEEDISFVPEIKDKSILELEKMVTYLKGNNIDPQSVSLKTYSRGVKQLVENINSFANANMSLDKQQIEKNPYLGAVLPERVNKDLTLIAQSGLSLRKPTGKIAVSVVTRETKKLKNAISLMAGIDLDYFLINPENMSKIIGGIASRITYCQQNGINYRKSNGEFESFIENENEFTELYGEIDTTIIPSAKECNKALVDAVNNEELVNSLNDFYKSGIYLNNIELERDAMNRFLDISNAVKSKSESAKEYEIVIENQKFFIVDFQKNLSYLLSLNLDASDKDLILASLMFNAHKAPEMVKSVAHRFDPNAISLAV